MKIEIWFHKTLLLHANHTRLRQHLEILLMFAERDTPTTTTKPEMKYFMNAIKFVNRTATNPHFTTIAVGVAPKPRLHPKLQNSFVHRDKIIQDNKVYCLGNSVRMRMNFTMLMMTCDIHEPIVISWLVLRDNRQPIKLASNGIVLTFLAGTIVKLSVGQQCNTVPFEASQRTLWFSIHSQLIPSKP